jgi:hypothetical protein
VVNTAAIVKCTDAPLYRCAAAEHIKAILSQNPQFVIPVVNCC